MCAACKAGRGTMPVFVSFRPDVQPFVVAHLAVCLLLNCPVIDCVDLICVPKGDYLEVT